MNFALLVIVTVVGICLGCEFDQCKNGDNGSCGNACCKLNIHVKDLSTDEVMNKLNSSLVTGGVDGLYIPMMTAEGTLVFGDLRPYDKPVDFIGQTWHTTVNGLYNDTINMIVAPGHRGTDVVAFSISQIAGAYGDDGQNYYNIYQLFTSVFSADALSIKNADQSCPSSS